MTGNHDSYLGISFAENEENTERNPEVIELDVKYPKNNKNHASKDEVLEQVIAGLKSIN